jgi:hypothetical protein
MADANQLKLETRTAVLLARIALAELARWSLENADVRDRLHRHRASRRDRALKLGAVALGFAVVALVVSRARRQDAPLEDAAPPVT